VKGALALSTGFSVARSLRDPVSMLRSGRIGAGPTVVPAVRHVRPPRSRLPERSARARGPAALPFRSRRVPVLAHDVSSSRVAEPLQVGFVSEGGRQLPQEFRHGHPSGERPVTQGARMADAPGGDGHGAAVSPSLDLAPDRELIRRCRDGESAAWDTLVRRYERLVYSVALRNGLSPEDAGDVCQSTFVTLVEALGSLRDTERLASWLMTVSRRLSWRVNGRGAREFPVADLPDGRANDSADWSDLIAVHDALAQVGQPCRDLLVAMYFDPAQPSYAELARRFDRSIGGIGPMRGRCLQRMRSLMTSEDTP
jgi:RNA polymerase sigma factor (sigma-70 family)